MHHMHGKGNKCDREGELFQAGWARKSTAEWVANGHGKHLSKMKAWNTIYKSLRPGQAWDGHLHNPTKHLQYRWVHQDHESPWTVFTLAISIGICWYSCFGLGINSFVYSLTFSHLLEHFWVRNSSSKIISPVFKRLRGVIILADPFNLASFSD